MPCGEEDGVWPKECEEVAAGRWVNEEVDVCPPREEAGGWWPREASRRARASRLREELLRRRPAPEPDEAKMMTDEATVIFCTLLFP